MNFEPVGPVNPTNSVAEILQAIAVLRGELTIPDDLQLLCRIPSGMTAFGRGLSEVDIALIELSTPIELVFRDFTLHHVAFRRQVIDPMRNVGTTVAKLVTRWCKGLKQNDEKVREEAAAELLRHVPESVRNPELLRAVLRETRSRRSDIDNGLEQICDRLGRPVGVVRYVFRYMPDGREVDWPPGFLEQVTESVNRLGLPTFDPTPALMEFGISRAFRTDEEHHYVPELLPTMGRQMIRFARSVYRQSGAQNRHITRKKMAAELMPV